MLDDTSQSFWKSRFGKILRFVAIVWALAAAYKLVEHTESFLLRSSVAAGALDSESVVRSRLDVEKCADAVAGLEARVLDEASGKQSLRQAWELGLDLGRRRA